MIKSTIVRGFLHASGGKEVYFIGFERPWLLTYPDWAEMSAPDDLEGCTVRPGNYIVDVEEISETEGANVTVSHKWHLGSMRRILTS